MLQHPLTLESHGLHHCLEKMHSGSSNKLAGPVSSQQTLCLTDLCSKAGESVHICGTTVTLPGVWFPCDLCPHAVKRNVHIWSLLPVPDERASKTLGISRVVEASFVLMR